MAKIGLSKPYFAKYANTGTNVTYSDCALVGKAVELSIDVDSAEDSVLYADNGPAESANTFAGGSFTLTTDDLTPEVMAEVLGLTEESITDGGIVTKTPKWYVWNDEQTTPYLGFGAVVKAQKEGAIKWQAVILPKIKFQNPSDTFTTQGESIEWGTPEITGNILRSDKEKHPWKYVSSPMDTEEDAEAAIRGYFSPGEI